MVAAGRQLRKPRANFKTALGFDRKDRRYKDPLAALQLEEATKDDFLIGAIGSGLTITADRQ